MQVTWSALWSALLGSIAGLGTVSVFALAYFGPGIVPVVLACGSAIASPLLYGLALRLAQRAGDVGQHLALAGTCAGATGATILVAVMYYGARWIAPARLSIEQVPITIGLLVVLRLSSVVATKYIGRWQGER